MRKLLALTAGLCLFTVALYSPPPRSSAQQSISDEVARRKVEAAEAKAVKAQSDTSPDFGLLKEAARARKGQPGPDGAAAEPDAGDVLAQSSKLSRGKEVAAADLGRSAEAARAFDELLAKARAGGSVRVIIELRTGFTAEGDLLSPSAVVTQRSAIVRAQDELLSRLAVADRSSVKRFETIPYVACEVDAAGVETLRAAPEVAGVTEDEALPPALAESAALVGAPAAWAAGFAGSGQTVAVLDTGVDKTHPFLSGKVVSEACFSTSSFSNNSTTVCPGGVSESTAPGSGVNCSSAVDGCSHGTHVAGIAAGRGANFSGVARDANVIAIQIFSRFDGFSTCSPGPSPCVRTFSSDQMKGLERVFALRNTHNIAAVNMSIGGGRNFSNCDSSPLKSIIDNLRSVGIATVIASGNDGFKDSLASPACISSAVSVGSTGDGSGGATTDLVSSFSNSASFLSLLAPGSRINSSVPGGFSIFQGTSMATPHVAGAWAVLKSGRPTATVNEVLTALKDTGLPVTDSNGITKSRIRVDQALNSLRGGGGGGGGGCGAPSPISFGQTVNGALSSTDCRFPAGSEVLADAYTFSGTAGQQVAVSMSSTAFDTFLHLIGPNGAAVATDDDGGGGLNSRIPAGSGFITLPSSGTYTIQARSLGSNTTGPYALSLTALTTDGCATITPITAGQTVGGALSTTDCRFSDGSFFDKYSFSGVAGQQVSVSMSSSSFDTYLLLLRPDGSLLAEDDDGGGGTNSRIPPGTAVLTLPTTGTYLILANSFSPNTTGGYSVTLNSQTPGSGCASSTISPGQTVGGTLSTTDCRFSDGSFFDSYNFTGTAGQQVSVSMSSSSFDTYLLLLRPDGSLLAEDDDGGPGVNSRIPAESGVLTLPVTGTYRILANSFSPNTTGSYSLTLTGTAPPPSCASAPISVGQTVSGALSTSDCRLSDDSIYDAYTFTGTAGQQVAVAMSSQTFDTFLFLLGPNGLVVSDDDGGGGLNSRIPPGTGFYTLPSAGAYTILANSFSPNVTGPYTLSLTSGQSSCAFNLGSSGQGFGFGGGPGSVGVSTAAGCGWSAVSNASWISITSGASGSGGGTVNYSVAANGGQFARTGTLTVAGRTFTVEQAANTASSVQFSQAAQSVSEAALKVDLTATRTGNTSAPASVDYASANGTADRRKDYTQVLGTLHFAPGETTKTITVFVTDDVFPEPAETFTVSLSAPAGTSLGATPTVTVTINSNDAALGLNPVDAASFNPEFFVRQHYVDFLNREADPGGLAFWTSNFTQCNGNAQCLELRRINVSAAFFLSIEFQETGYLVYRFYKTAFGDATSPNVAGTVPVVRLEEFLPDTQRIGQGVQVGVGDWFNQLEANKGSFAFDFVLRQRFLNALPTSLTPAQFVDRLNQNAGGVLSAAERTQLINELTANNTTLGRAGVLRRVADDADLRDNELRRAFVLMQYFGYMRRNPDDPQDTNFGGWKFWLDKLNEHHGDFVSAEMVKAFITSIEYKNRFGQ